LSLIVIFDHQYRIAMPRTDRALPLEIPARLSAAALERRRMPRGKCRHAAWVLTEQEIFCECVITDMSRAGARLEINSSAVIPSHFLLMADEFILKASLVWRTGSHAGVATKPFA
jgi:hypothetical protein